MEQKRNNKETEMFEEIKSILTRNRETLISDALGAIALFIMLYIGLSLPGLT